MTMTSPRTSFFHLESTAYLLASPNKAIIPRIHPGINACIASNPSGIVLGNTIQETCKSILQKNFGLFKKLNAIDNLYHYPSTMLK